MFYSLSHLVPKQKYSLKQKWVYFIKGVALHMLCVICSVMLIMAVDSFIVNELGYPSIKESFHKSSKNIDQKYSIFLIVILLPIVEELFFRLVLIPMRRNIAVFVFLLSIIVLYQGKYPKEIEAFLFVSVAISFLLAMGIFKYMQKKPIIEESLWKRQKIIIILSIVFFGLIHIGNIKVLQKELALFYPIYVLPQMFIGFFSSVLRVRLGFVWAVLFHSTINLIGSTIL